MKEIARSVKPGGGVLSRCRASAFMEPLIAIDQRQHASRPIALVRDAGLDVLFAVVVSLLLPALFLPRMRQQHETVDPVQEFRISPAVNAFGRTMMAVERQLIRAGASLPAGGSLLLVARRA